MLHRLGPQDEDQLIESLKSYLPLYGEKEKQICEIPYKSDGLKMKAIFMWLAEQWVYIESKPKPEK